MRSAINVVRKDWFEFRKPIVLLTSGALLPLLLSNRPPDFARGLMMGFCVSAAYCYAYLCFAGERRRGTLELLLSLPLRPSELVIAKFASVYSMALFTASVPTLFVGDLHLMFVMNALVIFFATLCMSFAVLSAKPWAPIIPMWLVLILFSPLRRVFADHLTFMAVLALPAATFIALGSALWFERSRSRN